MDQFRSIIQRGWTLGGGPFLRFVQSGCGFESFLLGGGYGLLLGIRRDIDAFRANEADVSDSE
jgi:hypothetical protein